MDVKMPKLGESVHEGTIEQWLVSEGDHVMMNPDKILKKNA
ncbi:biotin/lipoyl-containing protein [Streptococcus pneumoniae]